MNRIARKPVVGKFANCAGPDRCQMYIAQFVSFYVNYAYLVNISVKLHICVG